MQVTQIATRKGLALVVDPKVRPELVRDASVPLNPSDRLAGSWLARETQSWQLRIGEKTPSKILSAAAGSVAEASRLLTIFHPHPESEIHVLGGVDDGPNMHEDEPMPGRNIHWYEGESREILAWMIAEEGYWESFDFIHLTGASSASALLGDACQAWSLLKPGGTMMIEANLISNPGLAAFRAVYQEGWLSISEDSERIFVRRR